MTLGHVCTRVGSDPDMPHTQLWAVFVFILVGLSTYALSPHRHRINYLDFPIDLTNASAVFNAVNGAGKQHDSNIKPVGVSFIPAYIPANTPLFHSTGKQSVPSLFEWVAMDREFSYSFAHFPRHGKPSRFHSDQRIFKSDGRNYLYTFVNPKPLDKLIFLDGALAAKTDSGEMDQQLVLSGQEDPDAYVYEREAADRICKWGKPFGLQGVVRLEVGFEVIICNFNDLQLVSNVSLANPVDILDFPAETGSDDPEELSRKRILDEAMAQLGLEWVQAGSLVNHGEKRIKLDLSHMVTPLNKTWIDPDPYKRRLNKIPQTVKDDIRRTLSHHLKRPVIQGRDWQTLAERVVGKFSPLLLLLNNTMKLWHLHNDSFAVASNVSRVTFNFVRTYNDSGTLDSKHETPLSRALADYVPGEATTEAEVLIMASLRSIVSEIVGTLFDYHTMAKALLHNQEVDITKHDVRLQALLKVLNWADFTKCAACGIDQVCYVPTWGPGPFGWGISSANLEYLDYDGERYRIPKQLLCVSYKETMAWRRANGGN